MTKHQDPTPAPVPAPDCRAALPSDPHASELCGEDECVTCKPFYDAPAPAPDAAESWVEKQLRDPKVKAAYDVEVERDHCERVADRVTDMKRWPSGQTSHTPIGRHELCLLLLDERAAARQEGYNAHLEQLARHAQPTEDEREHCERVAESFDTDAFCTWQDRAKVLLRERTAARQEGYNAHLEQLAKHAQPTEDEREHCVKAALALANAGVATVGGVTQLVAHEFLSERAAARAEVANRLGPTLALRDQTIDVITAQWDELQSKHAALTAAARAAGSAYFNGEGSITGTLERLVDLVNAAPQTPTQREGAEPDWKQAYQNLKRVAERVEKDFGPATCECSSWDALRTELALDPEQGGGGCEHCGQPKHDHAPGCRLFPL